MHKITLNMRKIALSLAVLAAILLAALHAAPAHAVPPNVHSWVSPNGLDSNSCTNFSPCATFAQALTVTSDGGEVSCLDSGIYQPFTVTTTVIIDCTGTVASTSGNICFNNIVINAPGKVVTLRGLSVTNGATCSDNGILIQAATAVYIEDCLVEKFFKKGILDTRTTGLTKLAIKNTTVRNNGSGGIVAAAAPRNSVALENVHSVGNAYGIAVATGNNVVINRSVMSENTIAGIEADPGAQVFVDNTEVSHNVSYGIYALGTVWLANTDIVFNTSSILGSTTSYGNNRLAGNGGGTAPTPAGGTSTDFAQQ
jgi:hypothetical protein